MSSSRSFRLTALAIVSCASFASSTFAQFATTVVNFTPGPNANASFPATKALGGPQGGGLSNGSLDVCVLGVGGSLTLGFAAPIVDGPGADFVCSENGFLIGSDLFTEVAAIEVSTDGVQFARVPIRYVGPQVTQPAFGALPIGTFSGFVGGMPILANVVTNTIDPRDPATGGGDAVDLADLAGDPLVVGGQVDLANIQFVRIVDVPAGTVTDASGALVFDNGGATGSADIDAIAVVHDTTVDLTHAPVCDLSIDAQGALVFDLGDPDGFFNLDLASIQTSFDMAPIPFAAILPAFALTSFDGKVARFTTLAPVTGASILGAFAMSVHDKTGGFASDQLAIQG